MLKIEIDDLLMDYIHKLMYNGIFKAKEVRGQRGFYLLQVIKSQKKSMIISHLAK